MKKLIFYFLFTFLIFSFCSCNKGNPVSYEDLSYFNYSPHWMPDGKTIIFSEDFDEYSIDTSGHYKTKIGSSIYSDLTPDKQFMLYFRHGYLYKKRITGDTNEIKLNNTYAGYGIGSPSMSYDGQWIVYESGDSDDDPETSSLTAIWKMKVDGSGKKKIFYTPDLGEVRFPQWFPDGNRIAVQRYILGHGGASEIGIIDSSGNAGAVLTDDKNMDKYPKVSNDGRKILWLRENNWGQICTINADGTDFRQLTSGYTIDPDWSPDGKKIVYVNIIPGDGRVWTMNSDGSGKRKITH